MPAMVFPKYFFECLSIHQQPCLATLSVDPGITFFSPTPYSFPSDHAFE